MTKAEFVKRYNLIKTKTKALFNDGMAQKTRTIYVNRLGELYVFYRNDLYVVKPFLSNTEGQTEIWCKLGAGYSWYH